MISDGFRFLCWSIISCMARLNISSEMIQILDYIRSTHTDEKCRTHGCDQPCFFFLFLFFLFLLFAPFLSFFLEHHQRCSPLWVLQEHLGLDRQGVLNGALREQTRDLVGAAICCTDRSLRGMKATISEFYGLGFGRGIDAREHLEHSFVGYIEMHFSICHTEWTRHSNLTRQMLHDGYGVE